MKKWKQKSFAAGVNRDIISEGAAMLGMDLEEVIRETINGMKSCATNSAWQANKNIKCLPKRKCVSGGFFQFLIGTLLNNCVKCPLTASEGFNSL